MQGKGLREYFQRGTHFGLNDTVGIMPRLLEALAYAHEEGMVHRDSLSWLSICAKWIDTDVLSFALGWLPDQGSNQEPGLQSAAMTDSGRKLTLSVSDCHPPLSNTGVYGYLRSITSPQ